MRGEGDTAPRPSKCAGICILLYRDTHKREIFFRKRSTGLSAKSPDGSKEREMNVADLKGLD